MFTSGGKHLSHQDRAALVQRRRVVGQRFTDVRKTIDHNDRAVVVVERAAFW